MDTTPTRHSPNTVLMLGQRLRRWPNIEPTLEKCTIFEEKSSCPANTTHLYNIGPTSSTLAQHCIKSYKCFVFTGCQFKCGSARFEIPAVIQSMCLQINDQLRARAKGFGNYYLIDVAQVYMNFENLLLMRLWVWNTYLVLLWNRANAYPRALLHSGGPMSCEFWQLTKPLISAMKRGTYQWITAMNWYARNYRCRYIFFTLVYRAWFWKL